MKITTLRPFRGDEGFVKARSTIDVGDRRAAELVKKGLATYTVGAQMPMRNKAVPMSVGGRGVAAGGEQGAAKVAGPTEPEEATAAAAGEDPTPKPRRGSRTGAKKSRSSSRRGHQPAE